MKSVAETLWKQYKFTVGWLGRRVEDFSMYLNGANFVEKAEYFKKGTKAKSHSTCSE